MLRIWTSSGATPGTVATFVSWRVDGTDLRRRRLQHRPRTTPTPAPSRLGRRTAVGLLRWDRHCVERPPTGRTSSVWEPRRTVDLRARRWAPSAAEAGSTGRRDPWPA